MVIWGPGGQFNPEKSGGQGQVWGVGVILLLAYSHTFRGGRPYILPSVGMRTFFFF